MFTTKRKYFVHLLKKVQTRHCSQRKMVLPSKCTPPKKCSLQIAHPFKKCSPVGAHFPVPRKCSPQTAHLIRKCSPESMQQCKVHRNSRAYTVNAVHTHTLKRVPSQKCSLHCSVLTLIKVLSRTCSLHSTHCSPPEKCSPISPHTCQKCSPKSAHP